MLQKRESFASRDIYKGQSDLPVRKIVEADPGEVEVQL